MNSLERIDKEELRDLMSRCWMTHDAMWFYHSVQEAGIERTNRINRAAIRSMSALEVHRLRKALGHADKKPDTFNAFKNQFEEMFGLIKADFMKGAIEFPAENRLRVAWQQCFAHEGISKLGIIEQYQCGIFDRIEGWLNGLGLKFEVSPKVEGCMMHTEGQCYRDFKFFF